MTKIVNYQNTSLWHEILQYLNMGYYQQSMGKLRLLLAEYPNDGFLLYLIAFCYYTQDQYLEASDYCKAALQYGCSPENGHYLLGKIYLIMKKYNEAEQELCLAEEINPENGSVVATKGYVMFLTGREREGEKLLHQALDLDPINDIALHYNYLYNVAKHRQAEQLIMIHKSLVVNNKQLEQIIKVGLSKYYRKDYQSARSYFQQATEIEPNNLGICFYLNEIRRLMNPWLYPTNFFEQCGGSTIWGGSVILLVIILTFLKQNVLGVVLLGGYLIIKTYCLLMKFIFSKG